MHIGLIGGIGVSATVAYYKRLTAACPRGLDLTIVHADVTTLIAHTKADNRAAQADIYAALIDRLRAAGADCAAITSLGGHFCFAETEERASLPLISGIAPLDAHFAAKGLKTVGLLGTETVMRSKLYGQLVKTEALLPEEAAAVGQAYFKIAGAGQCSPDEAAYFHAQGREMINQGAQAIVLAGTDLGLAFDGTDPGYRVIDALDVHVEVLAAHATGTRS